MRTIKFRAWDKILNDKKFTGAEANRLLKLAKRHLAKQALEGRNT